MHRDKLYNKTNEMHFLEFYSDNILYMFRIGKLFIFRRQLYCTCSLWYVSCIHVDQLLPRSRWNLLFDIIFSSILIVVAAGPHECMIHTINSMYSKIASWRWIACLFGTCRGCYQNEIQENASRWFYYASYKHLCQTGHGKSQWDKGNSICRG